MIILGTTTPRARKEHTCCLCWRKIQPGERYDRARSIGDGGPYVWKQCAHCSALLSRLFAEAGDDWYGDEGYTDEDAREFDSDDEATIHLLTLFRDRWSVAGDLVPVPERAP